jgi:hypothetical protein
LKEILEDKNKMEKFPEVLSKEVEEELFDEFMINLISEKDRDNQKDGTTRMEGRFSSSLFLIYHTNSSQSDTLQVKSPLLVKSTRS